MVVAIGITALQLIALARVHIHPEGTEIMQYIKFGYMLPLRFL
jgi:hypothetical protein